MLRVVEPVADPAALAEDRAVVEALGALLDGGAGPLPAAADLPRLRCERREGAGPFPPPWRHPAAVDGTVTGPAGPIAFRRLGAADDGASAGTYVHVVGGGWCTGSADLADTVLAAMVTGAGTAAVCVAPRTAPEHPFPAPVDDVAAALRSLAAISAGPLVLGGDSTGAHLALTAALRLRDEGRSPVVALVLTAGIYDLTGGAAWRTADRTDPLLDGRLLDRYVTWFAPGDADRRAASPLHADLAGLPPLHLMAAGADPLASDTTALAARADAAGVDVELLVQPGAIHASHTFDTGLARTLLAHQSGVVASHLTAETGSLRAR